MLFLAIFMGLTPDLLAQPLPALRNPQHPYLAPISNLHMDSYYSKVSNNRAPASSKVSVNRYDFGHAKLKLMKRIELSMCLNFMMDNEGEFYGFCSNPIKKYLGGIDFHFTHFDKKTLKKKSTYSVFRAEIMKLIKGDLPLNLGYFTMDAQGRVIITNEKNVVNFIGLNEDKSKLVVKHSFSLADVVPKGTQVAQVTPDYEGRYWFMSLGKADKKTQKIAQEGYVGYYNPYTGQKDLKVFSGQVIENGFAVDDSGVYVLTDHQLIKLSADSKARINTIWAQNYQRATKAKPGAISPYGSGTSPTLLGSDLIAISDNADEQVNLLVFDRRDIPGRERLVCKVPSFEKGKSANENSVVGYGNSIVIQNWYNAPKYFGKLGQMEPGVTRIDVREDRSGCDVVWHNPRIAATSTLKLSTGSGYLYAPVDKGNDHFMALLNFHTGKVDHEIYLNKGFPGRYMAAPVFFGPDNEVIQPHFSGMTVIKEKK
jgi:hypothetical protein